MKFRLISLMFPLVFFTALSVVGPRDTARAHTLDDELNVLANNVATSRVELLSIATGTPAATRMEILQLNATRLSTATSRVEEIQQHQTLHRIADDLTALRTEPASASAATSQPAIDAILSHVSTRLAALRVEFNQLIGITRTVFASQNDQGSYISTLQAALKRDATIYPEGLVTGFYGLLTEAAVRRFQARYQLAVTGEIDDITLDKMTEVYGAQLEQLRTHAIGTPTPLTLP